ncbi:MAG: precorrin-6A/cobalt-precorrin-6A reductase [Thermoleophilia bacterium]
MTAKTIYLIGGTTEASRAAQTLEREGYRVVVSVATPLGESVAAAAALRTDTGRKDATVMAERASGLGACAIVDCSHPFAREVSRQAKKAAAAAGLPYLRYTRPPSDAAKAGNAASTAGPAVHTASETAVIAVESFEAAASELKNAGSRGLLTLGTRHLEPFVLAETDFTARVLPFPESISDCSRLGIEPARIIAAWPPFDVDFNRACLRYAGAAMLVTKDSGREGGVGQKIAAAAAEGAAVILVNRPADPGAIYDLDGLLAALAAALDTPASGAASPQSPAAEAPAPGSS